jgi:hypothetical protein
VPSDDLEKPMDAPGRLAGGAPLIAESTDSKPLCGATMDRADLSHELLGVDADLRNGASVASQPYHVRGSTRRVSGCLPIP